MANTYDLLTSVTIASTQASYVFSNITQGATHLKLIACIRQSDSAAQAIWATLNSNTGTKTGQYYIRDNGTDSASNYGNGYIGSALGTSYTASFFNQTEVTFGNYTSGTTKAFWTRNAAGSNSTGSGFMNFIAQQSTDNNPITSITITPSTGSILAGTKFWLYGLKNS